MQNQNTIKGLKLFAFLLAIGIPFLAPTQTTAGAQNPPARLFEIAGMNMPLEERIGVDDGAALVVHFAGDTRGSLDVCG
jgi:hypothetical protein